MAQPDQSRQGTVEWNKCSCWQSKAKYSNRIIDYILGKSGLFGIISKTLDYKGRRRELNNLLLELMRGTAQPAK